jgi:hypothetical protein
MEKGEYIFYKCYWQTSLSAVFPTNVILSYLIIKIDCTFLEFNNTCLSKLNTEVSLKPASSVFGCEKLGPRFVTEILAVSWLDTKI